MFRNVLGVRLRVLIYVEKKSVCGTLFGVCFHLQGSCSDFTVVSVYRVKVLQFIRHFRKVNGIGKVLSSLEVEVGDQV